MKENVLEKIDAMVHEEPVVILMKGTPEEPKCGFSMSAVNILKSLRIPIRAVDVLEDPEVRKAAKEYTDWPTFPQVFIGGEFIGGADILQDLHEKGELDSIVQKALSSKTS
jgi:monothiol glutaredoxin